MYDVYCISHTVKASFSQWCLMLKPAKYLSIQILYITNSIWYVNVLLPHTPINDLWRSLLIVTLVIQHVNTDQIYKLAIQQWEPFLCISILICFKYYDVTPLFIALYLSSSSLKECIKVCSRWWTLRCMGLWAISLLSCVY